MLGKQLIERTALPHDRRSVRVSLTRQDQALYAQLMPQIQAINSQILSVLSHDEAATLDDALERLRVQALAVQASMSPDLPKADRRRGRTASALAAKTKQASARDLP